MKAIGLIGIGVMGENLALNMESKGFPVAVYDIDKDKVKRFLTGRAESRKISGADSLEELVEQLEKPAKIMIMIHAGPAIDNIIEALIPYLDKGDIIIDGGNSYFIDSIRRTKYLEDNGFYFIGTGISGGEEGALLGPSVMPGGSAEAWKYVKPILQGIAAKTSDGSPCCDWVGENGAGHFVKMVHNGIEYGDMQLICEAYQILKDLLRLSYDEMYQVFKEWNEGDLESYLIEITRDIMNYRENGQPLVEYILDTAGQKGTGKWTVSASLDAGAPLTLIAEAVFARSLSALKDERTRASRYLKGPEPSFMGDKKEFISDLGKALYAAKIISYAQGFVLLSLAAKDYKWEIDYGNIALMWRQGCIIRSSFLDKIKEAYKKKPELTNLLLDNFFIERISASQGSWRKVVSAAALNGIWIPAFSSALNYFDGYRNERLPANLLQAQRDYFGAHMYERTDRPRGEYFHTNWTGRGGATASTVYSDKTFE
jgi:6-phosphogluconate dehydrogenase